MGTFSDMKKQYGIGTSAPSEPTAKEETSTQAKLDQLKHRQSELTVGLDLDGASALQPEIDRLKKQVKMESYAGKTYEDNFAGQFSASMAVGRLQQEEAKAWGDYAASPTQENRERAQSMSAILKQVQTDNAKALDEDATLPWLSQSLAGYLPQFWDQTKAQVGGAATGAALAAMTPLTAPFAVKAAKAGATAATGLQSYQVMRGRAFKELLDLGVDEETARKAANDEAVISSMIEMAETGVDLFAGLGSLIKGGGKVATEAAKPAAKKLLSLLGKYGLNMGTEWLEEGSQQAVSIANRERAAQGETGKVNLGAATGDMLLDIMLGRNKEAAKEVVGAGNEGAKIAAMMGLPGMAGNMATSRVVNSDPLTAAMFGNANQQATKETAQEATPNAAGERTAVPTGEDATQAESPVQGTQTQDALMAAMFGQDAENAASGTETASKYDAVQAEVIRREGKTFRNLVAGFDTKVSDFFNKWRTGRTNAGGEKLEKLYLGKMSDHVRSQVADILGYAVDERDVIVTNDDVKHIFDHHGDAQTEAQEGNIPLEQWMFDALPDIVTDPDDVSKGNMGKGKKNAGKQAVLFSKAFPGGTVVTVQFDNKGRKTMEIVTLYAKNKGATSELYAPVETDTSAVRPGRSEPAPIVDTTITQPADSVNSSPEAQGESGDLPQGVGAAEAGFMFGLQEEKFGVQEGGEKAVRPDDMPKMVAGPDQDGNTIVENVSRTAVTAKGAEVTPEDFVPLLQGVVMDTETPSGLRYMPITNDETAQKAMDTIMDEGWTSALANWTAKVRNGQNSPVETAIGALLYNHAVNSGDAGLALDILSDYATNVRNAAQSLQAARILKTMTPDNRLYMIRRSLTRMMADGKVPENITIGQELETEYLNAQSEQERDAALTKIQESVAAQWPGTWMEKWTALRYVNMLGNFKTQGRNTLGNAFMWVTRTVHNAVGTGLEQIAYMASGGKFERTRSLTVPRALSKAARADFANVKPIAMGEQKYSDMSAETNEFMRGVQDKRRIFKFAPLEGYRKITNAAMEGSDAFFSKAAYGRALAGWLKAHGITAEQFSDPRWQADNAQTVDKGRQFAIKEAQEATFRDTTALSEMVSQIRFRNPGRNPFKWGANIMVEGNLPFRKTPANVLVRAEEYSPLGLVNTAVQAVRASKPDSEITGADVINSLSKSLTGTGLFLTGMALRAKGLLRGGPEDDEEQAAFDDLTGHQDYSLELPDGTSITLDWLTPASMPMFMGVEMMDEIQENGFQVKDIGSALSSITEPMLEMSMMQGISDMLERLKYSESYNLLQLAESSALSYLTQGLTNSLVSHISQSTRDESLMTYVDKEGPLPAWLQREIGAASRKWPGEGYNQIPYIDAWGREEETGDFFERTTRNLFSPAYLSKVEVDKVEQELQRLYDKTGEGGVLPDRAEKSITWGGQTKQLTAEEYVKYAKAKGQSSYKFVQQAVNSAAYKSMSDSQKAEFVSAMYSYANYKAKKTVAPKYENETYAKYAEAERAGMSPAEYFLMDKNIDADGSNKQGIPTKAEAKTYLDGQTKLNQGQKADLWDLIQRTDAWAKANPYRK